VPISFTSMIFTRWLATIVSGFPCRLVVRRATMKASKCERKQKTKRGYRTRHKGIFRLPGGGYRVRARGLCPKTRRGREREEILPHATLHAAYQRQQELRAEIESEPTTATAAITLGDYARSWIAQQTTRLGRDDGHRYSTVRDRADVLEQHILPVVGQVCMDRLTRADLMRWQSVMQQKRKKNGTLYSNVTINNWWRILRAMVRRAVLDLDLSTRSHAGHQSPTRATEREGEAHKRPARRVSGADLSSSIHSTSRWW
jgi:hypothetical protein